MSKEESQFMWNLAFSFTIKRFVRVLLITAFSWHLGIAVKVAFGRSGRKADDENERDEWWSFDDRINN